MTCRTCSPASEGFLHELARDYAGNRVVFSCRSLNYSVSLSSKELPVPQVREFEEQLYKYVDTVNPGLLQQIMEKKQLDDNLKAEMDRILKEHKERFVSERQAVGAKAS